MKKIIDYEKLVELVKEKGYYATDKLLRYTYLSLLSFDKTSVSPGQDIRAICLQGPPGSGKTEYANTYAKLASSIYSTNVCLVGYQCDPTTGKSELYEDINISAVAARDIDKINVPGKIVEAIKKVNEGKKVVLFIDEYDKARPETDSFLLQFLQSGKINTTQHGDLEIKEEYKNNLQVIICMNDFRETLSGPLNRRLKKIRLNYMEPNVFYELANNKLQKEKNPDKVIDSLIKLVTSFYNYAYKNVSYFDRIPSVSEMLDAIVDGADLIYYADTPMSMVVEIILEEMFKEEDDLNTFIKKVKGSTKEEDKNVQELLNEVSTKDTTYDDTNLNKLMLDTLLKDESESVRILGDDLQAKIKEFDELINEYKDKFNSMESSLNTSIQEVNKQDKITIGDSTLVGNEININAIELFKDESKYIKRNKNILSLEKEWCEVGEYALPTVDHFSLIRDFISNAGYFDICVYSNGILLSETEYGKLIVVANQLSNGKFCYKFYSTSPIIGDIEVRNIVSFINNIKNYYETHSVTATSIVEDALNMNPEKLSINTTYSCEDDIESVCPIITDGIYSLSLNSLGSENVLKNIEFMTEIGKHQSNYPNITEQVKKLKLEDKGDK